MAGDVARRFAMFVLRGTRGKAQRRRRVSGEAEREEEETSIKGDRAGGRTKEYQGGLWK